MTVTVDSFREGLPTFADTDAYPTEDVQFWLSWALQMVNADRWGDVLDLGVMMFMAHNLTIEARNKKAQDEGGSPGGQNMIVSGTSVDKVSVSYDAASGLDLGAGQWNLTNYGTRFRAMAMNFGAGPMTIEGGSCSGGGGAFSGPWQGQFPNPSG